MGSTAMMYILPVLLGQTYDLGKERPGLQIYEKSVTDNATILHQYFADSQYRMVENSNDVKDFLDVSGKLSLKIKGGMVDVSGEGSYIKDSSRKRSGLEILIKVHYETVTKTIPTWSHPRGDWRTYNEKYLGTHFCRSITYGGDLVASIRISSSNVFDLEQIKGAINGHIKTTGGGFEAEVRARLEMLKDKTQDSSSMEINYYATVPLHGVSYTVEGLLKLVHDFPESVKGVNNGMGNPLRMELLPLNTLEDTYPEYLENRALTDTLDDIENQFDDLRVTRRELSIWITGLPPILPDKVQKKIDTFMKKVNSIYAIYLKTIADLDLSKSASTQPLDDAINAYRDGTYVMPQKYYRLLNELRSQIYNEAPELRPLIGGAIYTRWGRSTCETPQTETVLSGVMVSSETQQDGGSAELLCLPGSPKMADGTTYFPGYDPEEDDEGKLFVGPIRYEGIQEAKKGWKPACALCRTQSRTTVLVKPADNKCPNKWTKEYEGLLMAPAQEAPKTDYVCVDKTMVKFSKDIKFGNPMGDHQGHISEVLVRCGGLPCGPYVADKIIPCVVCTI